MLDLIIHREWTGLFSVSLKEIAILKKCRGKEYEWKGLEDNIILFGILENIFRIEDLKTNKRTDRNNDISNISYIKLK